MITLEHVSKRYGRKTVVSDFSHQVGAGESIALWGPNGAGKTTVVRCILGHVSYEGSIEVDGLDARAQGKAVRSRIGYVPQELAFYELDAPIGRLATAEVPIPYAAHMEEAAIPQVDTIVASALATVGHTMETSDG